MFCWLLISWGCWLLVLPYLPWHFHVFHVFVLSAPMMLKKHVLSESGDALKSLELHRGALMTGDEDWALALFVGPGVVDRLYGSAPCTCPFYSTSMIPHRCMWASWCKFSAWSRRVHVQVFKAELVDRTLTFLQLAAISLHYGVFMFASTSQCTVSPTCFCDVDDDWRSHVVMTEQRSVVDASITSCAHDINCIHTWSRIRCVCVDMHRYLNCLCPACSCCAYCFECKYHVRVCFHTCSCII